MNMERSSLIQVFLFLLSANEIHCDYASEEFTLLQALRQNYHADHRPNKTTVIRSSLALFALNKLDIGAEIMSMTGVLSAVWMDPRLSWNASEYGIQQIVIPMKYVWTPPLLIENEVNKVGTIGSDAAPLRVISIGMVIWNPPISTTTSCSVDITYYPYDRQTCSIILTGWSYTVDEVNLIAETKKPIIFDFYSGNGEWELMDSNYELINVTEDVFTFRKVHFNMTFRRKWQFYGQNVIIPIVLNSLLMAMVFVVPVESGEKMGYCLTVLLSYIVLLTIVSEDLPSISSQISVIQIYLSVVMCIGTAGTICTTGVLRLYNQDERKSVPYWMQNITRSLLAPLTCRSCKSTRVISPDSKARTNPTQIEKEIYSFKEIAKMIDIIFFRLFSLVMLMLTFAFLFALNSNY